MSVLKNSGKAEVFWEIEVICAVVVAAWMMGILGGIRLLG